MHNVCLIGSFGQYKVQVISCVSQNDFLGPQYVNILSILCIFSQIIGKKVAGGELRTWRQLVLLERVCSQTKKAYTVEWNRLDLNLRLSPEHLCRQRKLPNHSKLQFSHLQKWFTELMSVEDS